MTRFDAIIVGAGQAGPSLAGRLTSAGMTVALVERNLLGGTCVNTGCTPTKTLVASAYAAHIARRGADFGVMLDGDVRVDMAKVKARTDAVVAKSRGGLESWLRANRYSIPAGAAGAVTFAGSDTLIAWDRFVRPLRWAAVAIMVTYHVGQALFVVSLLD